MGGGNVEDNHYYRLVCKSNPEIQQAKIII
jgi:hypothetical protein